MSVTRKELDAVCANPMGLALERQGITPTMLAKKLKAELAATSQKVFYDSKTNEKGKVIGVKYSQKMIDWAVRQRARMDAHALLGHYPAKKVEMEHDIGGDLGRSVKDVLGIVDGRSRGLPSDDGGDQVGPGTHGDGDGSGGHGHE